MSKPVESVNKNSSFAEAGKENPASLPETSGSNPFKRNIHSPPHNKKTLEDLEANDEEPTSSETNLKRSKNKEENRAEDSSTKEASLEELIFSNDLILRNILETLNLKDLFSSRQVNRLWNFEATKLLLKNNNLHQICIAMPFIIRNDIAIYATSRYEFTKRRNTVKFEDFQNLVENSMIFPCKCFVLRDLPLNEKITDFFRNNGHLVKSLWFEPTIRRKDQLEMIKTTEYDILLLATNHLPNLETLKFEHSHKTPSPLPAEIKDAIECAGEMTKLHTLELNGDFPIHLLSLVLKKAKKLQNIYFAKSCNNGYYKDGLEKLLEVQDAILLLRNIHLELTVDLLDTWEKIVMRKPKFLSIQTICVYDRMFNDIDLLLKVRKILSGIFEHCSESLTEILDFSSLSRIPGLTFPVFPNLKRLEITITWEEYGDNFCRQLLPSGFSWAEHFPNIKEVKVCFTMNYMKLGPEKILPRDFLSPVLSVRHLHASFGILSNIPLSDKWVEMLCSPFPNLTSVRFSKPISDWAIEHLRQRGIRVER